MLKKTIILLLAAAVALTAAALIKCIQNEKHRLPVDPPKTVSLFRKSDCRIDTLTYEEYLTGCIFAEISPACGEEALKAAACAINCRTLCLLQENKRVNGAQLSDEEHTWLSPEDAAEEYGSSYKSYLRKVRNAVQFGTSHVLLYEDAIFPAPFCAISTGITEDGGACLSPKELPCDMNNDDGLSTAACSDNELRRILTELTGVSHLSAEPSEWFDNAIYTNGGTLSEIHFGGARLTGEQLRKVFALRSAAISVQYSEGRFLFTVRGIGDNLGMSLNAAAEMADAGKSAEEILAFFYSPAILCAYP